MGADHPAERNKLIGAELVCFIFLRSAFEIFVGFGCLVVCVGPEVHTGRPLLTRPDAVSPIVLISKATAGITNHARLKLLQIINQRFANAVVSGGQQYEDHFNPADAFPFSYAETTDHLTGRGDAILKRPETDPLVIHTQTSTEYWQRRGSLVHTDTRGNDLPQPPNARVYFWASSQHFADPIAKPLERGILQNFLNTVATSMLFRAMIEAMDRWATTGAVPPDSRIPRRADGTLVTIDEWRRQFPAIPGDDAA